MKNNVTEKVRCVTVLYVSLLKRGGGADATDLIIQTYGEKNTFMYVQWVSLQYFLF